MSEESKRITKVVAREMGKYAYWSEYDQCYKPRKGPNLEGIVLAVIRASQAQQP